MNTAKVRFAHVFRCNIVLMCKENHTICNVHINLTQPMFGSCFTSCLMEGACLIYVNCVCLVVSLQSQEILNRPVFVLDILKITKNFEKILNITENSEQILKILKIVVNSEQILNRF